MKHTSLIKKLSVVLAAAMLMGMTACGGTEKPSEASTETVTEAATENVTESATEAGTVSGDDVIIEPLSKPYYEHSEIEDVTAISDNKFSCKYEGVSHEFILYLPDTDRCVPVVLMLHGYGESAEKFRDTSHFEEDALPEGYAVCYVTGAPNPYDATSSNGWNSGIAADGNDDVAFLFALTDYLRLNYNIDDEKLYAVGFSNGAFMIHRLAVEAGYMFTGLVSVAGKMPESIWEKRDLPDSTYTNFFQVTGSKDDVVPLNSSGTAKYAKDPAIEDVISYWVEKAGIENPPEESWYNTKSLLSKYQKGRSTVIWNLLIDGGRHSWPDEQIIKININKLILEFFNEIV